MFITAFLPFLAAAALIRNLIALAVFPCLPITLPMSAGSTLISYTIDC